MSSDKPREIYLVGHPSTTEGWIYEDYDSALKRITSGLKNPLGRALYVTHVIEFSAYEKLQTENEKLRAALEKCTCGVVE